MKLFRNFIDTYFEVYNKELECLTKKQSKKIESLKQSVAMSEDFDEIEILKTIKTNLQRIEARTNIINDTAQ